MAVLSQLLIYVWQLSVTRERMCILSSGYLLRVSLSRKSVARIHVSAHPDITSVIYCQCKAINKTKSNDPCIGKSGIKVRLKHACSSIKV